MTMTSPTFSNSSKPISMADTEDFNEDILLADPDGTSRFGDEDFGIKVPLSPVSEEDDFEDEGIQMYDVMVDGVPGPPDGKYGWVIVFASFLCNLIVDGIAYTFGVFLSEFAFEFKEPTGKVAWVGSLLSGVYLSVGPIVSALTNKFGCRIVCISGSIIASIGFGLSALSPTLDVLMITYGIIGGIGFGLIYLPAVVCVGYYFEKKRALATGIAVCGSGVGTFVFAPLARVLIDVMGWRYANVVFATLVFCCSICGALMKPLEVQRFPSDEEEEYIEETDKTPRSKPLLQRMAEDKRNQMEKDSLAGSSYFIVQLPDGTKQKRMKIPVNVDPGVHSSFNLDQLTNEGPIPMTPNPNTTLPTLTEGKVFGGDSGTNSSEGSNSDMKSAKEPDVDKDNLESESELTRPLMSTTPAIPIPIPIPESIAEERETDELNSVDEAKLSTSQLSAQRRMRERRSSEGICSTSPSSIRQAEMFSKSPPRVLGLRSGSFAVPYSHRGMPRNGSAPAFTKNGSIPQAQSFVQKHSYKAVPVGTYLPQNASKSNLSESRRGSVSNQFKTSMSSFVSTNTRNNQIPGNPDEDFLWSRGELSEGLIFSTSHRGSQAEQRHIIRPLSRKDIFYSGSIANLPEFQSQRSINSYRQSVLNLPRVTSFTQQDEKDGEFPQKPKPTVCPCLLSAPGAFKTALAQLMDFSLMKNPVFLFIAISNVFGMLGFYVPFVYIISSAVEKGIDKEKAAFLLSIIGITNTIGRVLCGVVSDLPQVNSLLMNNMCILLSGICVAVVPLCPNYFCYVLVSIFFGLFVSGYVSLTSIILVDLLGLDNLTNAFGLLILFRGAASIVGAPLAGAMYDAFRSYDIPFYLAGGFLVVSAFISFLVPFVTRFAPEKKILQPPMLFSAGYLEDIPEAAESTQNNSTELVNCDQVESSL